MLIDESFQDERTIYGNEPVLLSSDVFYRRGYDVVGWVLPDGSRVMLSDETPVSFGGWDVELTAIWDVQRMGVMYFNPYWAEGRGNRQVMDSRGWTEDCSQTVSSQLQTDMQRYGYDMRWWEYEDGGERKMVWEYNQMKLDFFDPELTVVLSAGGWLGHERHLYYHPQSLTAHQHEDGRFVRYGDNIQLCSNDQVAEAWSVFRDDNYDICAWYDPHADFTYDIRFPFDMPRMNMYDTNELVAKWRRVWKLKYMSEGTEYVDERKFHDNDWVNGLSDEAQMKAKWTSFGKEAHHLCAWMDTVDGTVYPVSVPTTIRGLNERNSTLSSLWARNETFVWLSGTVENVSQTYQIRLSEEEASYHMKETVYRDFTYRVPIEYNDQNPNRLELSVEYGNWGNGSVSIYINYLADKTSTGYTTQYKVYGEGHGTYTFHSDAYCNAFHPFEIRIALGPGKGTGSSDATITAKIRYGDMYL